MSVAVTSIAINLAGTRLISALQKSRLRLLRLSLHESYIFEHSQPHRLHFFRAVVEVASGLALQFCTKARCAFECLRRRGVGTALQLAPV